MVDCIQFLTTAILAHVSRFVAPAVSEPFGDNGQVTWIETKQPSLLFPVAAMACGVLGYEVFRRHGKGCREFKSLTRHRFLSKAGQPRQHKRPLAGRIHTDQLWITHQMRRWLGCCRNNNVSAPKNKFSLGIVLGAVVGAGFTFVVLQYVTWLDW